MAEGSAKKGPQFKSMYKIYFAQLLHNQIERINKSLDDNDQKRFINNVMGLESMLASQTDEVYTTSVKKLYDNIENIKKTYLKGIHTQLPSDLVLRIKYWLATNKYNCLINLLDRLDYMGHLAMEYKDEEFEEGPEEFEVPEEVEGDDTSKDE